MEKAIISSIGIIGFIFILLILIKIIICHIVIIRAFFYDKEYDKKILVYCIINCLPSILIYFIIKFTFKKNKCNSVENLNNDMNKIFN
jgi:cytochrome c oxidase subunit IV